MRLISNLKLLIICLFISACDSDDGAELPLNNNTILSEVLSVNIYEEDAVIACAASTDYDANLVNVYFYPEAGAESFKLYEPDVFTINGEDFSEYNFIDLETKPLFNGALRFFETTSNAAWFTVVYQVGDVIKVATPIRNKKSSQPSQWTDEILINQQESGMPIFSWDVLSEENNAIFFEVLTTESSDLISGTYTYNNQFQYYKLDNVVLNITPNTPPNLISGNNYIFTVMDVSLDNWVNQVIMTPFTVE